MSRRKRNLLLGSIVLLMVAVEVVYYNLGARTGCVSVVNQAGGPIENIRLECAGNVVTVARLDVGETANVYLPGQGNLNLKVAYKLAGSALSGFVVNGFNPADLRKESFKLVLVIRQDEWERYQDDAEPSLMANLAGRAQRWLEASLDSP